MQIHSFKNLTQNDRLPYLVTNLIQEYPINNYKLSSNECKGIKK